MTHYDELIKTIDSSQQEELIKIINKNPEIINHSGTYDSPLHFAVAVMAGIDKKKLEPALNIVLSLISLGADPLKKGMDDEITPLAYAKAILNDSPAVFSKILNHCEDLITDFDRSPFEDKLTKKPTTHTGTPSRSGSRPLVKVEEKVRE